MAVVCGLANSRKWRWIIYIVLAGTFSVYCFYDGWINPKYQLESEAGNRLFNQVAVVVLVIAFVVLIVGFFFIRKTRVAADDNGIDVNGKFMIAWKDMARVNDKNIEKGLLDLYYLQEGTEKRYILDNYKIDHFEELLDELSAHRPDLLAPTEETETNEE